MQTANSLRESVMSSIRAVWYIAVYGVSAFALMAAADWRLGLPTLAWFLGYVVFLRHFVPRMRDLARASSEVRSLVMARIVDSYTNILTVKLFARLADEDAYVSEVIDEHQAAIGAHMRVISQFMFWLAAMNALLLTGDGGRRHLAVGAGHGERGRGGHGAAAGLADHQRGRLGELGSRRHLRERRRGAGGHADDRGAARAASTGRMRAARGVARRDRASRTCRSATASRTPRRCSIDLTSTSARASGSGWWAARARASRRW